VLVCGFPMGEEIDPKEVAKIVRLALSNSDLEDGAGAVALTFAWDGTPDYQRLSAVARGIGAALPKTLASGHPLVVVIDGDVGMTLGRILSQEVAPGADVIALDGIQLKEFDYVDIGQLILPTDVVPVIIKSLLF
jgi:ethanolamine utilization protein EutA